MKLQFDKKAQKKLSDVNYIVNTPGRRKQKQLCHINMLNKSAAGMHDIPPRKFDLVQMQRIY